MKELGYASAQDFADKKAESLYGHLAKKELSKELTAHG